MNPILSPNRPLSPLSARHPRGEPGGFTLLEVLLAITIFAILSVVILSTFRTGTRAYEDAERQASMVDQARFVLDQLERDVHTSKIPGEDEYNRTLTQKVNELTSLMNEAQMTGDNSKLEGYLRAQAGLQDGNDDQKDQDVANAELPGVPIDLLMYGEPEGDDAKLSFVIRKPVAPGQFAGQWGVLRITYYSKGGILIRETEPVQQVATDIYGQPLEDPPKPTQEILAQGVKRFALRFGYWYDETWLESDRWNSGNKEFRNSFNLWTEDPDPDRQSAINTPGTPEYQNAQQQANQAPYDKAPTYVRVLLQLADIKNPKRVETFTSLIRFPQSQETFIPNSGIDDDRKDAEIEARKDMMKYPGGSGSFGLGAEEK